ncbi:MFS transporter [Rhizohabitans arisaemae]|uniref:MFS transporter n=1 Tax=Rhizohabitans arisaemae TaxID=2720610 RepID=UPI0024B044F1|nr:MFS transporter [Rhizohabitans arisaemae]
MNHPRRWWILVVLCLSLMVVVVDNSVLNVAIPSLIRDLGATNADIQWIIDSYVLVFAGLLLTAGSLSDRYGRRRALVVGLVLFGVASAVAALARTPEQLIAARAFMGVGGAILMPSTLSILVTVFDDRDRKKAIAIWSAVAMVAVIAGPALGGLLIEHFWWGSVFLLNIPVAVVALIAALVIMPESTGGRRRLDPIGALLSMVGMSALVWAVISLPQHGWTDYRTLTAFGVALVGLTAFTLWELRRSEPMLPLALFRDRDFSGASLSIVLLSFGSGGLTLVLTQYLQFVLGYGAMQAGFALAPMAVTAPIFNGVGVVLDRRIGSRFTIVVGFVLMAAGFGVLTSVDGYPILVAALIVMGMGAGVATPAAYGTMMGAVPREHAGVGSAVNDTVQQVGYAISVAVLGSVLAAAYRAEMPAGTPAQALDSIGAALAIGDPGLAETAKDAFTSAMTIGSIVGAVAALGAAVVAFALVRAGKPNAQADSQEPEKVGV